MHYDSIEKDICSVLDRDIHFVSLIERVLLALAIYEGKYGEEKLAKSIAIDQAVILAKRYGRKESSRFVNGVLDRFLSIK